MNQALKKFTFILIRITVVGSIVLYFLKFKNKYATDYWKWIKDPEKKAYKLWENLPADIKILIAIQAKYNANKDPADVKAFILSNGLKPKVWFEEIADIYVLAGSKIVRKIDKEEIKWLEAEREKEFKINKGGSNE